MFVVPMLIFILSLGLQHQFDFYLIIPMLIPNAMLFVWFHA